MSKSLFTTIFLTIVISGFVLAFGAGEHMWSKNYAYTWMVAVVIIYIVLMIKGRR